MKKAHIRKDAPTFLDVKALHQRIDKFDDYRQKLHQAAIWYAENGIAIIPFLKNGYPIENKGTPDEVKLSQRDATTSVKLVNEWWHPTEGKYSGASIAMAHGGKSGFCAVDLDTKDANGIEALADLAAMYGEYSDSEGSDLDTLMAHTPSGGRHLVFRYHPEIVSNSEVAVGGIDTRGGLKRDPRENGGITFIEPSKKPNSSGHYRWDESCTAIIDMPQWLVDVLNKREPEKRSGVKLQDSYVQSAAGLHGEGRDRNIYMDLMKFVGIGYDESDLWDLMPKILERMNPPDEEMVRRKIESVINSEAFKNSKEEHETKKQVHGLKLDRNEKDMIIKSSANLAEILNWSVFEHEVGLVEYDDFSHRFVMDKKSMDSVSNWATGIQLWISNKLKIDFPVTSVREMVEHIAYSERPHINTARDYFLSCPQPSPLIEREDNYLGSGRLAPSVNFERLCSEVLDLNNENLHTGYTENTKKAYKAFLWFWMQGVAARACVPACKMEIMLNMFGGQGIGKSLFFRDLCPEPSWFTDSIQDTIAGGGQSNRDELMKLHAKVIIEMPELNPVKRGGKSGDNKMKQFLSSQVDNYRRPYGYDSVDHPRTFAFCGSSNDMDVYRDPTGDRRFVSIDHGDVPIKVGDQDNGVLAEIRDALWGEVVSSFKTGELDKTPNALLVAIPPKLRPAQKAVNTNHRFEEAGIPEIIEWMAARTRVTWPELIEVAKATAGLRDAKESQIMSQIRQHLGQDKRFSLKKSVKACDRDGTVTTKSRIWVNTDHPLEKESGAGKPVPPHWSTYENEEKEPEEY